MSWSTKLVGSPTAALVAKPDHAVRCALTVTSEKQDAVLYEGDSRAWSLDHGLVVDMCVKVGVLPTLLGECVWGLCGDWADGPDAIQFSVFFTVDGSGEVFCEMDDNATDRSVSSGITLLADEPHQFRIDASNKADVKFYIDGAQVATGTVFNYAATAGANSTLQLYVSAYKASGAGLGRVEIDSVRAWMANRA
jgi:hypothetical protein